MTHRAALHSVSSAEEQVAVSCCFEQRHSSIRNQLFSLKSILPIEQAVSCKLLHSLDNRAFQDTASFHQCCLYQIF